MVRGVNVGQVSMKCYHAYYARAIFGGWKKPGIERETLIMALEHDEQPRNLLVNYSNCSAVFF